MDNITWLLIGVLLVAAIGLGVFFLMQPQDKWIEADGVKVWKIPSDAEIMGVNTAKAGAVKNLAQSNKLIAFVGEAQGAGTIQDQEVAKLRAYSQIAELLNANVSTFAQLVEGQLQNVQVSGNKSDIVSASTNAYKRVTELFAAGRVSGAYVYATWRVKEGNLVHTYVLLVYDPEDVKKFIEMQPDIQQAVNQLGNLGVDFFTSLNSVIDQAMLGTPLAPAAQTPQQPAQPTQPTQPTQPAQPIQPTPSLPSNVSYMKGIGEAYGNTELEAEEVAKKNALTNLSEQLYVDVQTTSKLNEQLLQTISNNTVRETLNREYQKTIETKSQFEFIDVRYNVVDKKKDSSGKYYAKVEALVEEENTKKTFETYISLKLAGTLLDSGMVFTAKGLLDKYEPLFSKYKFPPTISQEIALIVGKIRSKYAEIDGMVNNIKAKEIKDFNDVVQIVELLNALDAAALDVPDGLVDRERLRPYLKDVRIELSGPTEVLIGEQVSVEIKSSANAITSVRIINDNIDGPNIVTLKDGKAVFSGIVKAIDSKITVSIGGLVNTVWAPGKVLVNPDVVRVISRDGDKLRILAGGSAKPGLDTKATRDNAIKDALTKIVRKSAAEVLLGQDKDLLDVPIDEYIVNKVSAGIDYEITATGEYQGIYFAVVSATVMKERFQNDIRDALKSAPSGFAMLIVDGDSSGYIEPAMISSIVDAGIKLVSKDFSKKILEEQQRLGYNLTTLGKLAVLSSARYVLYTKVTSTSTYVSDYGVYSVRTAVSTQIIDSITGNILTAPQFEEVNTGATAQAAVSKIVNGQNFKNYVQQIINSLNFENVQTKKVFRYTFVLERAVYGSMLMDYLNAKYEGIKIIEKADTKLVIETNVDMNTLETFFKTIDALKIKKISDYNYQVTK